MTAPIPNRALYQEVADRLRQLIYDGELAPGAFVDERALATRFGISRTPLREALKVLHAEGLVRLTPRRGSWVAGELTPQDLDEIFPLMSLLEGLCAYEAVKKCTPAGAQRLEELHARLERNAAAGDVARYYAENYDFHEAVQELAANPYLSRAVSELRRFLRLLRGRQLRVPGRMEASLAEHRKLMRALRRRDPEAAERLMRAHLMAQRAALAEQDRLAAREPEPRRALAGGGAASPRRRGATAARQAGRRRRARR